MSENPHAGQGSVLLDIGGDVGALVVEMPAQLVGVEVEIRPVGRGVPSSAGRAEGHHQHVAVVARPGPSGPIPSLVFPQLTQGRYALCHKGGEEVEMTAEVVGGRVTQEFWPG